MLGQPLSMLLPEVIGFKLDRRAERRRHRHRPRADRHPDAAQEGRGRQVRRVLRPRPDEHDARRPRHHRQHGAGIWRDLRLLPDRRARRSTISQDRGREDPRASRWSRPTPRRRACCAPARSPIRSSPIRSSSTSARSRRRSPAPSVRRTALRWPTSRPASRTRWTSEYKKVGALAKRYKVEGDELRPRPWRRRHRRHHLLHQHLEPERADRRRACWRATPSPRAERRSPGSRPRSRPGSQVVAEYLDKAGLQKSLDKLGFNIVGFGCTTCIGNSGPLPRGDLADDQRARPGRGGGAVGQPQFRGPRQSPTCSANYLASPPLVVAYALAGSVQIDLDQRAARPGQAGQAGLSRGHLAEVGGDPGLRRRRT